MTDTKQQLDRKARRKLKRKLYGKYEEVANRYKELKNKAIAKSSITRVLNGEWNNDDILTIAIEVAEEEK